jgi:hypothetical protein
MSRSPTLLIGSSPARVNANRTSAS